MRAIMLLNVGQRTLTEIYLKRWIAKLILTEIYLKRYIDCKTNRNESTEQYIWNKYKLNAKVSGFTRSTTTTTIFLECTNILEQIR